MSTATANRLPTEESFLRDVAEHQMTVRHDDGLYRHLRFQRPGTWAYGFDVTTWPGFLCFSGDMGCYAFSRVPDMIEFFRVDPGREIDFSYWAEKCQAVDRYSDIREYDPGKFEEAVTRVLDEAEASREIREAVEDEVLAYARDGEHAAVQAAMDFERDRFRFHDFWEFDLKEFTPRFLWCCYALAWAVRKYDEHKEALSRAE